MVNECTLVYETEVAISMTVADAGAIPKGSVLMLSDPMTVAITTGDTDTVGGIAKFEKIASDGTTKLAVYRGGFFKGVAGVAGVTVGRGIITDTTTSAVNRFVVADANSENIFGMALETATNGETFYFELRPTTMRLA